MSINDSQRKTEFPHHFSLSRPHFEKCIQLAVCVWKVFVASHLLSGSPTAESGGSSILSRTCPRRHDWRFWQGTRRETHSGGGLTVILFVCKLQYTQCCCTQTHCTWAVAFSSASNSPKSVSRAEIFSQLIKRKLNDLRANYDNWWGHLLSH